ncbi:hypothetical protein BKA62DRAFT_615853 [Auriculariales sp. MPI-PUGE-AT-0066]|nr:hypothetical protein BKA62DRAFT_615853 [Auriculariales sp. MPI-PUGE-AT-0066]
MVQRHGTAARPHHTFVASTASSRNQPSEGDITRLAPLFGIKAGVNPTGSGDCDGVVGPNGEPIRIPCQCPPNRKDFIKSLVKNIRVGHVLNNPTVSLAYPLDGSKAAKQARLNAAAVTLQNLEGEGKGCPIAATTWKKLGQAIEDGTDDNSTDSPPPTSSSTVQSSPSSGPNPPTTAPGDTSSDLPSPTTPPSDNQVARLAPPLGWKSGINPTGTGNCDGAVKDHNGQPIQVPCSCPPSEAVYISALRENVRAGKAVNNPTVPVAFPTDDSRDSKRTRIQAAIVTIQNLHGIGIGCPAVSTTLGKQLNALDALVRAL